VPTILAYAQHAPGGALTPMSCAAPGALGPHEVDVEVLHCSVCHSDIHLLDGDWGDVARPLVPGHEIVGRVVATGVACSLEEGAVVGIGWQAGACFACAACTSGREHLCTGGKVRTCVGRAGGFATRVRVDGRFCFVLPGALDVRSAAPLLCAGLTVFSPLERLRVGPSTRIAVVGLGGLGHLAVRIASTRGAEVVAFDPDPSKKELARALGARDLALTDAALPTGAFDVVLVTTHAPQPWSAWMDALDLGGTLCLVGVPGGTIEVPPDPLLDGEKSITGSVIGSPACMRRMLDYAAQHGIAPLVEHLPLASANEAVDRVRRGAARMRVVLDVSA